MNWPIIIPAIVGGIIYTFILGVASFYKGNIAGYEEGYKEGKIHGNEEGYSKGHGEGYQFGEANGFARGKGEGYKAGEAAGWLKRDEEAKEKARRIAAKRMETIRAQSKPEPPADPT